MRVVNFSEARNSLKSVIDQVIDDADYTVIARRDAPDAVGYLFAGQQLVQRHLVGFQLKAQQGVVPVRQ